MEKLPGIKVKNKFKNPTIDADGCVYEMPFYKDSDYFFNLDNYVKFIKSVEKIVRQSKYYSRYVSHIKKDIGINFCQVKGNIKENEDDKLGILEMHHGPILTLFDCIAIVLEYRLSKNKPIDSFTIANIIIKEHFEHNIQTVMLCETVHQEVHSFNVFLNMKQGFGDINAFLKKYKEGILPEHIVKINRYIELSEKYDSFDKDVMKLNKNIRKWASELNLDDYFE